MQFIPEFIARKKGLEKIEYDHPKMESYLNETYGIMLYQEQIMQVVQVLGGFTLGGSDILRRAIGKKKLKELEEQKAKFVRGCAETNNINETLANQIWEKISKFAGYGFNKSHSAAYAYVAYQTAYLKANYPVEFMTAVLCSEIDSSEQITFFINECREMGIPILPPDINSSDINFTVDGKSIRFGLGAIKNVGEAAAGKIIESRQKDGKYKNFLDFCERAGSAVNSRMLEHLTRAGAFDSLGLRRSQLLVITEPTMSYAQSRVRDRDSGQGSLFDLLDSAGQEEILSIPVPDIPEFDENDILKSEKELLGFYITGHPLAKYAELIKTFSTVKIRDLSEMADNVGIRTGGIVKSFQRRLAKNSGKPFAIMELEDLEGSIECMVYAKCLEETEASGFELKEDVPLFVEAFTSQREESEKLKLIAERIIPIDKAAEMYSDQIHFHIYEGSVSADDLKQLFDICKDYPGDAQVILCISCITGEIVFVETTRSLKVRINAEMLQRVKECLGEKRFKIKANKKVPEPRQRYFNPKKAVEP
jgi:DNA polymerase-3 subunit alpha